MNQVKHAEPTTAPTVEIQIFGETHTLKYGFRAFDALKVNPFNKAEVEKFEAEPKSVRDLAAQVQAGLLHEYHGRRAPRKGETPPTVEEVMDELDPLSFVEIAQALAAVKSGDETDGEKSEEAEEAGNPPLA